ncbi:sugar phosphate isomerase/epimerase family protein [Sphingomonas sp.]|uniref:sugar phosphate isomerase/epimerase family protein n=1 Tax=Sphingomonas sp. TaxID=28214 RepID=UPI003BAD5E96
MMIDRRQWLAGGAALATGFAAAPLMARATARSIGLQLYTVRELFAADPIATLEKVAAIGYREVEYGGGGYDRMDHAALRKAMDRLGLKCPSIHVGYEALAADLGAVVRMAKTLGADTIVLPWLTPPMRDPQVFQRAVGDFNRWAAQLKQAGLGFAYHNHDFEFTVKAPDGRSLFDLLVADGDPALVKIELDLFWAVAAREDVKAVIKGLPGRIYAYHVKDRAADGRMVRVGAGVIDFADIFALNSQAGVQHLYVENDQAPAPYLPDIKASFDHLRRIGV